MSNTNSRTDLTKIEIGNKATGISQKCFTACYNLGNATIPTTVTVIGKDAFLGAKQLSSVIFEGRTAEQVSSLVANIADIGLTKVGIAKDKDGNAIDPSIVMKAVYEDGSEAQTGIASDGLKRSTITALDYKNIESLDFGNMSADIQDGCFLDCNKLTEVILDGMEAETVAGKVADWDLGIDNEGNTHLVVIYCKDGVVVINDADSSSGEMGLRIDWDKFAEMLEDYPNMTALPAIGTSLIVPYKVDPDGEAVDTQWEIIGYNTSIPQYVKYKDAAGNRIYVSSLKSGLLGSIAAGDAVYVKDDTGEYSTNGKTVASIGSETFTYGNNCTWTAPMSIIVDGTSYAFVGYNCNIASKYALAAKYNGTLYHYPQFRSYEKSSQYRNDWSTSELRDWMNGNQAISTQKWYDLTWNNNTTGTIVGMTGRMTDAKFMLHAMPTVNRTWVHSSWTSGKTLDSNSCEHVVDKFWTLGIGNVNCSGSNTESYFKDQNYDTSKFSETFNQTDIWTSESSHIRRAMKEDGSEGTPCYWWLRSAYSNFSHLVGGVYSDGYVSYNYASNNLGVLPACTIC